MKLTSENSVDQLLSETFESISEVLEQTKTIQSKMATKDDLIKLQEELAVSIRNILQLR